MSIQDDVVTARKLGMSRKQLATLSKLTEGKIWRIEHKGTTNQAEIDALQPVLDRIIDPMNSGHPRPTVPQQPTSTPAAAPAQTLASAPPATSVGIDWGPLQRAAAEVRDHEVERLTLGPDPSAGYRLLSNSEIQAFKTCRRKWWLAWYRGLKLRHESPVGARAIGDRVHRALKLWYTPTGLPATDPRAALERFIVEDWTRLVQLFGAESTELLRVQKQFNDEATLERAMIEGYLEWVNETGRDTDYDVISSEQYVEADISDMVSVDQKTKLIGKIDVRVRRKSDGVRLFLDHKTVGNLTQPRQLTPMDEQMLHYHLLEWLNTSDGEERCDGALYNMLRKVKRTSTAKPPFYDRVEVRHNKHELESFKRRIIATVSDIYDVETALNDGTHHLDVAYPRPSRDCAWMCDFFPVCPMFDDGSRAESMLSQYYRESDPLSYYGSESEEPEGMI